MPVGNPYNVIPRVAQSMDNLVIADAKTAIAADGNGLKILTLSDYFDVKSVRASLSITLIDGTAPTTLLVKTSVPMRQQFPGSSVTPQGFLPILFATVGTSYDIELEAIECAGSDDATYWISA